MAGELPKPQPEVVEKPQQPAEQPKHLTLSEQLAQAVAEMCDTLVKIAEAPEAGVDEKLAAAIDGLLKQVEALKPKEVLQAARKRLEELGVVVPGNLRALAFAITTMPPTEQLRQLAEKAKTDPCAAATGMIDFADAITTLAAAEGAKTAGVRPVAEGVRTVGRK